MKLWQKITLTVLGVLLAYILLLGGVAFTLGAIDAFNEEEAIMLDASECDRLVAESLNFTEDDPAYRLMRDLWMAHCP